MSKTGIKITIRSGPQAGTEYWLTKRLTRVGSAAGCDIPLLDSVAPPHAISIERVDDQIVVHNRMERPLSLDSAPLGPAQSRSWPHAAALRISPQSELILDCFASTITSAAQVDAEEEERADVHETQPASATHNAETTPAKAGSSNLFPLLFIAGCMGMIAFLIYFKLSDQANASANSKLTWGEVWKLFPDPAEATSGETAGTELSAIRTRFQLLYRFQGLGDAAQFERTQGEILRALDRAYDASRPSNPDESPKAGENLETHQNKLDSLRGFVKSQKVGAS